MPRLLKTAASLLVGALMCGLLSAALAQSTSLDDLLADAGAIRSPAEFATIEQRLRHAMVPYSEVLPKVLFVDENLYVYLLQARLNAQGAQLSANGLLTSDTVAAIKEFCAENGLANDCAFGPMTAGAAAAIGAVLDGMASPQATPKADATQPVNAVIAPPVADANTAALLTAAEAATGPTSNIVGSLPTNWFIPFAAMNGIALTITETNVDSALLSFSGTATADGSITILFGDPRQTAPGEAWTATVRATDVRNSSSDDVQFRLRTAVRDAENQFIDQLVRGGANLLTNVPSTTLSGTVPENGVAVQPYVELSYKAASAVDVTVRLASPSLTRD